MDWIWIIDTAGFDQILILTRIKTVEIFKIIYFWYNIYQYIHIIADTISLVGGNYSAIDSGGDEVTFKFIIFMFGRMCSNIRLFLL